VIQFTVLSKTTELWLTGHSRNSKSGSGPDFQRFLSIALGSNAELRTQLYIARRIGVIEQTNLETLITEAKQISAMLNGLRKSLKPKLTKN
jgi:four helix bundle protein